MENTTPTGSGSSNSSEQNQKQDSCCCASAAAVWNNCTFMKAVRKAWNIAINPKNVWPGLRDEKVSVKELLINFTAPLAAIPVVCCFVGKEVFGVHIPLFGTYRPPFFHSLVQAVIGYAVLLVMTYVFSRVLVWLAPKFGGTTDEVSAFKLVSYSWSVFFLAGVLSLIPALAPIGALISLYGIYLYYEGIPVLTTVTSNKRLPFLGASFGCAILIAIVLGIIVSLVGPSSPEPLSGAVQNMLQVK